MARTSTLSKSRSPRNRPSSTRSVCLPGCARAALTLRVLDEGGRELIRYTPLPDEKPHPGPATAAKPPRRIQSNEELFLNGLHLEQYRHATYAPEPYYQEALRRDPRRQPLQ
jgi:hypothetical protein